MAFRMAIPETVERALALAPERVREELLDGLFSALRRLEATGGAEGVGERVEDLRPPMFILCSGTHWLLYEVDTAARQLMVHTLARMPRAGDDGVKGG